MLGRHHARHDTSPGRFLRSLAPALVVVAAALLILGSGTASAAARDAPRRDHGRGHWFKHTCAVAPRGSASCNAQVVTNAGGTPLATTTPPAGALGPGQFARAYSLPTSAPSGATIAIVDAYDNPNIENDLAAFSAYYGLPACTTANGCFRKVNQSGGTTYPSKNTGWGLEIALDVETAHGICQTCKILLVEATSPTYANLGAAENQAVRLGASVIANSWGGAESAGEVSFDSAYFNHPGVVITASTGDSGYGVQYPASSPYVVAVGGTTLSLNADNSYKGETAWRDGGSGCSAYETKPAFQSGLGCARRTVADVSADADPNTGAAIYDTYGYGGWVAVGGTSLSAPLIAGVYALSGNTSNGAAPYANPGALHDVKSGSNGTCSPASLCTAGVGYDAPTGLGTPNGLAAFGGVAPPPPAPDFALAVSPASQTVTQGQSASYTVTMSPNASFGASSSVSVTASAAPSDLALSGCSTPLTAASPTCTLTASTAGASASSHALTVSGAGSGTLPAHGASAALVVQAALAPDFGLAVSPATQTVTQGQSASYTVTIAPNAAFGGGDSVAVSVASVPADLAASGCSTPLTAASPTCTLTLSTSGASASSHALTVSGAGSGTLPAHGASAALVVQAPLAPDFGLAVSPATQTVTQGQSASYTVTISPNATFGSASVSVGAAGAPADIGLGGCTSPLTAASPSCTLTVTTTGASAATHALTVTGTGSGGLPAHSGGATLVVQAPQAGDFSLSLTPASRLVFTPGSTTFTVTVNRLNGFSGQVALSVSGLPSTFTSTFSANPSATTSTLTITAPRTSFSTIRFTVSGTSNGVTHTQSGSLTVL